MRKHIQERLSSLPKVTPLDWNPGLPKPIPLPLWPLAFDIIWHEVGRGEIVRRVVGGLECVPTTHPCLVSETRLVEVLEGVCSKSDFECHRLLELSEELVESWWFHK